MAENKAWISGSDDNVATIDEQISEGGTIEFEISGEHRLVEAAEDIPKDHKIAIERIDAGEEVIKYGREIGSASQEIHAGEWVHTHNVESNYDN